MAVQRRSLWRHLPAVAFLPALLLPFATLQVFASGASERAEPIIVGAHGFAALAALAVAVYLAAGGRLHASILRPALPAAILAVWSCVIAWLRGTPLVGIFGVPQSGLGALWFVDLTIWLVAAGLAVQQPALWRRLTDLAAAACWGFALITIWGQLFISRGPTPELPLLFITTAWPALAVPMMLLAHRGGPAWRLRVGFVLGGSIMLLIAAGSAAFLTVAGGWAVAFVGIRFWGARMSWLQSRHFGLAAVAVAALLPCMLLVSGLAASLGPSMHSRVLTIQVVIARLQQQWDIALFGLGWGRTSEAFAMHLDAAQTSLWDWQRWDFLFREFFHSHNLIIEALLAVGLPGAVLVVAIPAMPVWLAPPAKRLHALVFSLGWMLLLGIWFELSFVLPLFALAVAALCHDESNDLSATPAALRPSVQYAASAGFVAVAVLLCVAAAALMVQMASVDRMRAWFDQPRGLPPQLVDPFGDDRALAAMANRMLDDANKRTKQGRVVAEDEIRRFTWAIATLDARLPDTRNATLPIVATNILSELALNPGLAAVEAQMRGALTRWSGWLDRAQTLAPNRSDVAVGYLTWRFTAGDYRDVLLWARRLRNRNPDDPVGLYFEGGVHALQADPQTRQQGILMLRRALELGIDRFIPLNDEFKARINAAAG